MSFSVTPPGLHQPEAGLVSGQLVLLKVRTERGWSSQRGRGRGEVSDVGVTGRASPGREGTKSLQLSWALVALTWNSSTGWLRQENGWKSEANLGYTV